MNGTVGTRGSSGRIRYGVTPATITLRIREPGSAITHFVGLILVLMGSGPLLIRAGMFGSGWALAGMWVFLISSAMLYAASTVYHTVVISEEKTRLFKKIDHMMISVMIAGAYTAGCFTVLRGKTGFILLAVIWIMAAGGILLKALWVTCPRWISSLLYLVMGWACIFALPLLAKGLPAGSFALLVAGGLLYSIGSVIYALRLNAFNARHPRFGTHEIFHLFIMAGTVCHYIVMYTDLSCWN